MLKIVSLTACAALIFAIACQREVVSGGDDKEIVVIADSVDYRFLQDGLSRTFEPEIPTPWPEKIFVLNPAPVSAMESYIYRPRLLLIGVIGSNTPAAGKIDAMLTPQIEARILRGENYVFKKDDPWAKGQRLLVLTATDIGTLKQRLAENREALFDLFHQPLIERTKKEMYSLYEQKELAKTLLEKYGWTLRIQHDFQIYKEFPNEHFVMLRRSWPERWLFVSWQRLGDPSQITLDWVVDWRNQIGAQFYEKDRVAPVDLTASEVEFAGRRALQVQGLWENDVKVAGGPFKTWAFYDEHTRKAFLVDIAVFVPGQEKVRFLRQLEIMARTFRTQHDTVTDGKAD
jgi:hypothetical protein